MALWVLNYFAVILVCSAKVIAALPPIFIKEPMKEVYALEGDKFVLPCEAIGKTRIKYTWRKDRKLVDLFDGRGSWPSKEIMPNTGSLIFNRFQEEDEGFYQCFAKNRYGTIASDKSWVRRAYFEIPKAGGLRMQQEFARTGSPIYVGQSSVDADRPRSVPKAVRIWIPEGNFWKPENRILIQKGGPFIITNSKEADNGLTVSLHWGNPITRQSFITHRFRLNVQGKEQLHPVSFKKDSFRTRRGYVYPYAVAGKRYTVDCIFVGNPAPIIQWKRRNSAGQEVPVTSLLQTSQLFLNPATPEDEGEYVCTGRNNITTGDPPGRRFKVRVLEKPQWKHKPTSVNATVGQEVTFRCEAKGYYTNAQWYINGGAVYYSGLSGIKLYKDRMVITSVRVKDDMVVQCNISNPVGYRFTNAYLHVIH